MRGAGLMRVMFVLYLVLIAAGIACSFAVGFLGV
jgi:hypothetical protein